MNSESEINSYRDDENFIGFDKYTIKGYYHWKLLRGTDKKQPRQEYVDIANTVLETALKINPKRILDIGCGDGATCGLLAEKLPNSQIYGFDAEPDAIKYGREALRLYQINNVILSCFLLKNAFTGLPPHSFDFIFSVDVIEHLPNPKQLIELIKFLLKPGGTALVGTPLFISKELVSKYHIKEFNLEEIRELLGDKIIQEHLKTSIRKDSKIYEETYYLAVLNN